MKHGIRIKPKTYELELLRGLVLLKKKESWLFYMVLEVGRARGYGFETSLCNLNYISSMYLKVHSGLCFVCLTLYMGYEQWPIQDSILVSKRSWI